LFAIRIDPNFIDQNIIANTKYQFTLNKYVNLFNQ